MGKTSQRALTTLILLTELVGCQSLKESKSPALRLEITHSGKIQGITRDLSRAIDVFDSKNGLFVGQVVLDGHSAPPRGSENYAQPGIFIKDIFDFSNSSSEFAAMICLVKKIDESLWQMDCNPQSPEKS